MASVSFPQINTYPSRFPNLDFSSIANLPNAFWQGQQVSRENQARQAVSEALKRGDIQSAAAALAQANPAGGLTAAINEQNLSMPRWAANPVFGNYYNTRNPNQTIGMSAGAGQNPQYTPGTPDQLKAQGFWKDAASANADITKLQGTVNEESAVSKAAQNITPEAGFGIVGSLARGFVSADAQQLNQVADRWVNAVNYRDSGATVNKTEREAAFRTYIPVPGDKPETLASKERARTEKLQSLQAQGGPLFNPTAPEPTETPKSSQYKDGQTATNPQTGERLLFQNGAWVPLR